MIREARPDVVLLDVHMPDGGGHAVIEAVHAELPEVRFLALSVSDAAEDVIDVIRAGARGYVTKSISPTELVAAVRRIHDGDAVFSSRLAGFVLDAFSGEAPPGRRIPISTSSPPANARCCATSLAAMPTRKWRIGSGSRSRPSSRTSPPCSASSSSRTGTS